MKNSKVFNITLLSIVVVVTLLSFHFALKLVLYEKQLLSSTENCKHIASEAKTAFEEFIISGNIESYERGVETIKEFIVAYQNHPEHRPEYTNNLVMAYGRLAFQKNCIDDCNLPILIEALSILSVNPIDSEALFMFELFANPDGYD